jgi:hypothetical protein
MTQGKNLEEEVTMGGQRRPERRDRPKDVTHRPQSGQHLRERQRFLAQTRYWRGTTSVLADLST